MDSRKALDTALGIGTILGVIGLFLTLVEWEYWAACQKQDVRFFYESVCSLHDLVFWASVILIVVGFSTAIVAADRLRYVAIARLLSPIRTSETKEILRTWISRRSLDIFLIVSFQLVDIAVTMWHIEMFGSAGELNPLVRFMLEEQHPASWIIVQPVILLVVLTPCFAFFGIACKIHTEVSESSRHVARWLKWERGLMVSLLVFFLLKAMYQLIAFFSNFDLINR